MQLRESITKRNVLVAVDVQNDFIDGSLAVTDGEQVVLPLNTLAARVRNTYLGKVAFTRDWHPSDTPHFEAWPIHCVQDTEGAAFSSSLDIKPEDSIISKGTGDTDGYSGTEGEAADGTTLETIIQPKGWEDVAVFIGGLATDYCVKATALGVRQLFSGRQNVDVYAVRDAMRGVNLNEGDDVAAIKEMADAGIRTISLNEALAIIDTPRLER